MKLATSLTKSILICVLLMITLASYGLSQGPSGRMSSAKADSTSKSSLKSYAEVITHKAMSMHGMFSVHQIDDKYFFELPDSIFGRDIMAITRMSKTPTGAGYGGEQANRQVFRFEKGPSNKVFIRVVSFVNVSQDTLDPIYQAVQNSNLAPITAAFDIKALRKDTSVVIDATAFLNAPPPAFDLSPVTKQIYKLRNQEKDRSYIAKVSAYPINVECRSVQTYSVNPPQLPGSGGGNQPSRTVDLPAATITGYVTFEMNISMILLPKEPMRKRLFDPRVGIFASRQTVFDGEEQRARTDIFTVRWRLEAKNAPDVLRQQNGELIEPIKPIVFYIDPATPEKWRSYLKQGIEDWQPAFEQAGWKNAILAKDWPVGDTTMSLEDARFSVIRYFASEIENAYGPNVHDPRSGEIIESHIGWYHNIQKLLKKWYTIQTAAVDQRARSNELEETLMGKLVRFVAAHEVGHTLGLRHNFGASFATPVEKLRDPAFTSANGHTSSIMDYARFNYVAQPGDGVTDLFPRVGDYDKWAIEWNYKPIYNTTAPEEDKKILNKWYLDKAANNPRLHFITESSPSDPRAQSEDLSDNSMKASLYGIQNLQRIVPSLIDWTKEEAEHYEMAEELYNEVFGQFRRYIGHVTKWVGGIMETPKTYDQAGVVYEPAPSEMQKDAVAFLNNQLFQTPQWLFDKNLFTHIRPDWGVAALGQLQESTLNNLLTTSRLQRIIETSAGSKESYSVDELFSQLRSGLWSELNSGMAIDSYRRNLQKIHLEKLIGMLSPAASSQSTAGSFFGAPAGPALDPKKSDIMSVVRYELGQLRSGIKKKVKSQSDKLSGMHLEDCLHRIDEALDRED